jgi:hypothetical protein
VTFGVGAVTLLDLPFFAFLAEEWWAFDELLWESAQALPGGPAASTSVTARQRVGATDDGRRRSTGKSMVTFLRSDDAVVRSRAVQEGGGVREYR